MVVLLISTREQTAPPNYRDSEYRAEPVVCARTPILDPFWRVRALTLCNFFLHVLPSGRVTFGKVQAVAHPSRTGSFPGGR